MVRVGIGDGAQPKCPERPARPARSALLPTTTDSQDRKSLERVVYTTDSLRRTPVI
jgi:hypothetical protein